MPPWCSPTSAHGPGLGLGSGLLDSPSRAHLRHTNPKARHIEPQCEPQHEPQPHPKGALHVVDTTTATRQSSRSLLRISRGSHSLRGRSLPGTNATQRGAWGFQSLQEGAQACSGGLCCTASEVKGSGVGYAIGALDGEDANDGENWGAQVCMVVRCDVPGEGCLQYRPEASHGGLTALTLHATGLDQGVAVFPEVPQPPLTQHSEGESTALIGWLPLGHHPGDRGACLGGRGAHARPLSELSDHPTRRRF